METVWSVCTPTPQLHSERRRDCCYPNGWERATSTISCDPAGDDSRSDGCRNGIVMLELPAMSDELLARLRRMPDAKKLAIAIYGESVASYRYSVIAEKALSEEHRKIFTEMKEEEHRHQRALERLAAKMFPDGDFVLSDEDKEFVIVGARLLQVTGADSFRKAMSFLHDTERKTGQFYQALHQLMPDGELGEFLEEMAGECFEHAKSLLSIDPPS